MTGAELWRPKRLRAALGPAAARAAYVAIAASVVITGLIRLTGYDPLSASGAALRYALGTPAAVASTVAWCLPLLLAALGVAIAFRSGMFNIGAEGQLYAGAMAAAIIGAYVGPLAKVVHLPLMFLGAAAAGGAIAAGLGWLRARLEVDEVLSTLLSNYVVVLFTTYLANGPLRDPTRQSGTTRAVHDSALFQTLVPRTQLTTGLFAVIALLIVVHWLMDRSAIGYRWRTTGLNPSFAGAVGFDVGRMRIAAMAASGAVCASAGAFLVATSQGRFWTQIGVGIGWDAVLLALVAAARPLSVVGWTLGYSVLRNGALGMEQAVGVPSELSKIVIAVLIIAVAARSGALSLLQGQLEGRLRRLRPPPAASETDSEPTESATV